MWIFTWELFLHGFTWNYMELNNFDPDKNHGEQSIPISENADARDFSLMTLLLFVAHFINK